MEPITLLDHIFATFWKDHGEYVVAEEKFRKLSLDERFSYFYNILKKKKCLPDVKVASAKSPGKAVEFKSMGDRAFCENRDVEAVKYYTKSAAASLPGSAELASAYANRSAALYRLQRYMASLVDINRALKSSYPETLKSQLQVRKRNCIIKFQSPNQSISSLLSAVEKLAISLDPAQGMSSSQPSNFEFDGEVSDMNYYHRFAIPPENYPAPTILPFVNQKVKIKYNPQFGRHVVATEDITPGETIGIEKPFASVLSLDYKYSHCANCYVRCESLIPCSACSLLMFCSEKCRNAAYRQYHRVECKILLNAEHFDIRDDIWLAVRILMIVTKQGEELKALMKHPIYKNPMKIDPSYIPSKFDAEDYVNIHNLEDNAAKASFEENYTLGFTAALIVHILKHSSFFDEKKEPAKKKVSVDLSNKECYVGALLLKFLFIVKHNALKISEAIREEDMPLSEFQLKKLEIGSTIYIFSSYFNHSCEENAGICFHKNTLVSRSVQLINTGEQIFLNYGMYFGRTPCEDRQKYLREEYKFDCSCQACKFDWPLMEGTNAVMPRLKRNSITSDGLKVYVRKTRELRKTASISFNRTKYDLLCSYMETYHKSVKKPWMEYHKCQEKLKEVFLTAANYYSKQFDDFLPLL